MPNVEEEKKGDGEDEGADEAVVFFEHKLIIALPSYTVFIRKYWSR